MDLPFTIAGAWCEAEPSPDISGPKLHPRHKLNSRGLVRSRTKFRGGVTALAKYFCLTPDNEDCSTA